MTAAYLNATGDVVGESKVALSLAAAQALIAAVTEVIDPAPAGLVRTDAPQVNGAPAYYHRKTSGDGTLIGHYTQIDRLGGLRRSRHDEIDARTTALIAEGFTYSGAVFSLSLEAQAKMLAAFQTRNDAGYAYPEVWNSLDDTAEISLADAAGIKAFVKAGHVARRSHMDSGTALKQQVRAAADAVAVLAVVDNR